MSRLQLGFVSTWRCRDHSEPVSWRGRGCQACQEEAAAREIARQWLRAQRRRIREEAGGRS